MICLGRLTPRHKLQQVNNKLIMISLPPVSTAKNITAPLRTNSQESERERIRLTKWSRTSEKAMAAARLSEPDATITVDPIALKRSLVAQLRNEKRQKSHGARSR